MKNLLLAFCLFAIVPVAQAQENTTPKEPTEASYAKFDHTVHNFGIVEYNGDGTCEFKFTNTGDKTIVIKNVRTSCGCTTPDYSKDPIPPGETGVVKAKYDTKREGQFTKSLTVYFMDDSQKRLTIKGNVKPKPATPSN